MIRSHCTHKEGPQHDCDYVEARNALIPTAEVAAHRAVNAIGLDANHPPGSMMFGRRFFAEMNMLAMERGLARLR